MPALSMPYPPCILGSLIESPHCMMLPGWWRWLMVVQYWWRCWWWLMGWWWCQRRCWWSQTHQTRVMGTGFSGVENCQPQQPVPIPATTRHVNLWNSLSTTPPPGLAHDRWQGGTFVTPIACREPKRCLVNIYCSNFKQKHTLLGASCIPQCLSLC